MNLFLVGAAGIAALALLRKRGMQRPQRPPGMVNLAAPIPQGKYGKNAAGDVRGLGRIVAAHEDGAGDVAGDVQDGEEDWLLSGIHAGRDWEYPLRDWETFYRQWWLPASKVSPTQIDQTTWKLVWEIVASPASFIPDEWQKDPLDKRGDGLIDSSARESLQAAQGDVGDTLRGLGWFLIVMDYVVLIFSFGLSSALSTDNLGQKSGSKALAAADAHDEMMRAAAEYKKTIPVGRSIFADLGHGDVYFESPTRWDWIGADGKRNIWIAPIENEAAKSILRGLHAQGKLVLHESDTPPNNPYPLTARVGGGKEFFPRMRFFLPGSEFAIPWNTPALGSDLPMRERVNLRARLYRAFDYIASIMNPYEKAGFGPDGLVYFKRASKNLYSYYCGAVPVVGSIFPPTPDAEPMPGHDDIMFSYQRAEYTKQTLEKVSTVVKPGTVPSLGSIIGARRF